MFAILMALPSLHVKQTAPATHPCSRRPTRTGLLTLLEGHPALSKQPRSLTIHGKSHGECCRIKQQSRAWRDGLVAVHDLTLHTVIDAGSIWRVSSSESRREKLMSILRSQFWR